MTQTSQDFEMFLEQQRKDSIISNFAKDIAAQCRAIFEFRLYISTNGSDLFVGNPKTALMPEVGAWLKKVKEIQK